MPGGKGPREVRGREKRGEGGKEGGREGERKRGRKGGRIITSLN